MAKATKAVAAVKGKGKPGKGAKPVKGKKRDAAQSKEVGPIERGPLGGRNGNPPSRAFKIEALLLKQKPKVFLTAAQVEELAGVKAGRRHLDVMHGAGLTDRDDTGNGIGWALKPAVRAHIAKGGVVRCHKRGGEGTETFGEYLKRAKAMAGAK